MRFSVFLCSLFLSLPGWTAPGHAAQKESLTVPRNLDAKALREETPAMKTAEVHWQVIAVRKKGVHDCPKVKGWDSDESWLAQTLRAVQPNLRREQLLAGDPLLKDLDRYCSYRRNSGSLADFPLPQGLETPAYGHMAVVPSALDPAGEALARHFVVQAAGMDEGTAPGLPLPAHPQRVRLVFLDTQPAQPAGEGVPHVSAPSRHGYTLARLAYQLICHGAEPCPVEIATRLALAYPNFDPDETPAVSLSSSPGGNLGLVDDLAAAIAQEVFAWRCSGSQKHLILNLSLGWNGELLRELDEHSVSRLPPDARLVYEALRYARRSKALVIAAAGNRQGGGESYWPLLPAAWELRRPSWWPFAFFGAKPVYAVGGVDWQGLPLPNYRLGGLPRRVAFGDHAVAETTPAESPTGMYTGSSVSTAVASSIAAVVWQMRPSLRPAEVMGLVTSSGRELRGRGNYYAWKSLWPFSELVKAPHLRQLSLCRAVTRACPPGEGWCASPKCTESGAVDLSFPVVTAATAPAPAPVLKTEALPADCAAACKPSPRLFANGSETWAQACPLLLLPDQVNQRWVHPQPDDPPCPSCSLIPPKTTVASLSPEGAAAPPPGYVLTVDIDPKWWTPGSPFSIDTAALDVDCYSGHGNLVARTTYVIPTKNLLDAAQGSHRLYLEAVGDGGSLAHCTATLNSKVTVPGNDGSPTSVQSPVYVDP